MSTPHSFPAAPTNLEQQHKRAKDLLRAARDGDPAALARIRAVRADAGTAARPLKLADAQLAVAREGGFDSWPAARGRFPCPRRQGVLRGGAERRRLRARNSSSRREHVRTRVNDPMFAFGQRAAHIAAKNEPLLTALLAAGADVNLKSDWENGPYTVLDNTDERTARFLLSRGATLTPNVAARLGWFDELQALVDADGALVHARGGDGQQPLHEAKTVAIADFLLDRGADIDVRCIDHKSTPAQYALVDRPEVCRRLLERGATPDIFMAARLGDVALAARLVDADPGLPRRAHPRARLCAGPAVAHLLLDDRLRPVSARRRAEVRPSRRVRLCSSPAARRGSGSSTRCWPGTSTRPNALIADEPSLLSAMTPQEHGHLARAIFHEQFGAAELMLRLGFDPAAPGVDGGSALHAACWVGNVRMVQQLLERGGVSLDARDPTHQSTPLGWAAFGSVHRRARGADYPAVVDRLVAAGADITAVGNGEGRTLVAMAQGNPAMQAALRRHGAV